MVHGAVSWGPSFRFSRLGWEWPRVSVGGRRRVHAGHPWIPGVPTRSGAWPDTRESVAGLRAGPSTRHRDPRAWVSRPHVLAKLCDRPRPGCVFAGNACSFFCSPGGLGVCVDHTRVPRRV